MNTSRIDHESEATPAGLKAARRRQAPFWQEQKDKHVVGDALISGGAMMLEVRRTEWPSRDVYSGSLNWDLTAFGSHAEVGHMPAEISPELRAEFERWKNLIPAAPDLLEALREVVAVFESNPESITDTVWVTGDRPETLYDCCRAAIAKAEGGDA